MYPIELGIKNTTESTTSASFCRSGGTVNFILPFMTNVTISISISQIFCSWVAIYQLRPPMTSSSYRLYYMPGLAPRMNVLFWGRQDFQISFASRDTSRNAWNMIDTGFLSNNIKFLSHECLMTFWSLNKYNDNPPPIRLCVNPWPFYQTRPFTDLWEVSIEHLRRMLTPPETWSRPIFGLAYVLLVMINPFPELVFSFWTFHFEHPSMYFLDFSLFIRKL